MLKQLTISEPLEEVGLCTELLLVTSTSTDRAHKCAHACDMHVKKVHVILR